jgi:hypothetical protein
VDTLRKEAMAKSERGDTRGALDTINKTFGIARHWPVSSWRTVENYDDAGLYYFLESSWEAAAYHQAIAVLLACGTAENKPTMRIYVQRLGWAFAKYRPDADFAAIEKDPLRLLVDKQLNLNHNADIRRRFYEFYDPHRAPKSPLLPVYRLNTKALPKSCY